MRCATSTAQACQPVAFGYDADKLLAQAGAETIVRDPANGRLTGSTAGGVVEQWQYNDFGEPRQRT